MATDTGQMNIVIKAFNKTGSAFKGVNTGLGKLRHSAMNLRFAMAAIAGGLMVKDLIDTSVSLEKLTLGLNGATGSAVTGAAEFEYLNEAVDRLKLNLKSSGEAFTLLTAASRGTVLEGQAIREAFEAVSISSKVLGRSAEDTKGILYAMQQMISKGTVTSEELKRQMGDRLPGAFKLAAKAMQMTERQLTDAMKKGDLYTTEFLPKFTKTLMETYGGQLPAALESTQSKLDELSTAMFRAKASLAESGIIDVIKAITEDFSAFLGSDSLAGSIEEFGQAIKDNKEGIQAFFMFIFNTTTSIVGLMASVTKGYTELNGQQWRDEEEDSPAVQKYKRQQREKALAEAAKAPHLAPISDLKTGEAWISDVEVLKRIVELRAAQAKDVLNRANLRKSLLESEGLNAAKGTAADSWMTGKSGLTSFEKGKQEAAARVNKTEQQLRDWNAEQDVLDADRLKEKAQKLKEYAALAEGVTDSWITNAEERAAADMRAAEMAAMSTSEWLLGARAGLNQYGELVGDLHESIEHSVTTAFSSMEDAIVEFAMTGKTSFADLANSIISDMMRIMVQQSITGPLASGLMGAIGGVGGSTVPDGSGYFADGAAFGPNGVIKAFATGGIVNSPTMFPFANGTGLMGEAGPEGILPLKRINGRLGVEASGGGGSVQNIQVDARGSSVSAADIEDAVKRGAAEGYRQVYSDVTRRGPIRKAL